MLKDKRVLLLFLWMIVQGLLLVKNGIVTSGEAEKYIREADSILHTGTVVSPNFWLYATQSILITIDKMFNAGFLLALSVQMIFSLWATFSFYQLVAHIFFTRVAFWATVVFLLNYPFQEFNTFLQTESLYYSFTLIFTSYLLRLRSLGYKEIFAITAFLCLLAVTRPTGILFLPAVILYILFQFRKTIRIYGLAILSVCTILFVWILNETLSAGGRFNLMFPFKTEQVICFVPQITDSANIDIIENDNSLYSLLYYITHNFAHFIRLAIKKCIAFFGLIRYYFSAGHNVFLAAYFYPMYVLSLLSIRYWIKEKSRVFVYFVSLIAMILGTAILTCDDWHNRFFLSISPYFIILSIPSVLWILRVNEKMRKNPV